MNQRKGRVKQLFDLEISFEYKSSSGETGTGLVSEFTADYEDPTDLCLKLTPKLEKKEDYDEIIKSIGGLVEEFKKELYDVHGKPLLLEVNSSEAVSDSVPANTITNTKNFANAPISTPATSQAAPSGSAIIEDEVTFPCPPEQIYLMLTDSNRIRSWSRSPVTPQVLIPQAPFTLFDGNISGKILTLQSPSRIEMEWKLKSWGKPSNVLIEIKGDESGGGTVLKIKQTGLPNGEAGTIKDNWHNYYWNPIKRAFGGMIL